jgi:hypothetical protein
MNGDGDGLLIDTGPRICVPMIVYAVVGVAAQPALGAAIKDKFPTDHLEVTPSFWLVAGTGTAQEISDKVGLSAGKMGSAVVFSTAGYYGRAPTNVWEWIKVKLEAVPNA